MGSQAITPVALLILSNVFMTFAWYGHLKFKHLPMRVRWNEMVAFGLILAAVVVATLPGGR